MSTPLSKRKTPTKPLHMSRTLHARLKWWAKMRGITMTKLLDLETDKLVASLNETERASYEAALPKEAKP